jgi:hypothetical protein
LDSQLERRDGSRTDREGGESLHSPPSQRSSCHEVTVVDQFTG